MGSVHMEREYRRGPNGDAESINGALTGIPRRPLERPRVSVPDGIWCEVMTGWNSNRISSDRERGLFERPRAGGAAYGP